VVASSRDLEDTSFRGDLGVEGPHSREPSPGLAWECFHGLGLERGVLRWVVVEWGHSSSEEGVRRTCLEDMSSPGSGMEMGRGASSVLESDQVEQALGARASTLVADACTENRGHWLPSCSEPGYPGCTPPVQVQENGSSEAKGTLPHKSDGCSTVEWEPVPRSYAVVQAEKIPRLRAGVLDGCSLGPAGMHV